MYIQTHVLNVHPVVLSKTTEDLYCSHSIVLILFPSIVPIVIRLFEAISIGLVQDVLLRTSENKELANYCSLCYVFGRFAVQNQQQTSHRSQFLSLGGEKQFMVKCHGNKRIRQVLTRACVTTRSGCSTAERCCTLTSKDGTCTYKTQQVTV